MKTNKNTQQGKMQEGKEVVVNKNCHSRVSLSGISTTFTTQGGDPEQKPFRMTPYFDTPFAPMGNPCPLSSRSVSMRDIGAARTLYPTFVAARRVGVTGRVARGFTLIELLVVVLIISILAAVALPQYNKAVIKARFAEAMVNLKALSQAQQVYELSTGEQAGEFAIDNFDIEIPKSKYFDYWTYEAYMPTAHYKVEDVCLCYYKNKFVFSLNTCGGISPTLDYAKLLNIEKYQHSESDGSAWCYCC